MPKPPLERRLIRWQALSGLVFAAFATVHLVNTMFAIGGHDSYDRAQGLLQTIYRFPAFEIGIVAVLVVHVAVAIIRIRLRRRDGRAPPTQLRARLHRISGYFLMAVVFLHIVATRVPSLFLGVELGAAGVSFTFWWMPAVFWPYYILLGACGVFHGIHGVTRALQILRRRPPRALQRGPVVWCIAAVAIAAVTLGIAGIGGLLYPIDDPTDNDYARYNQQYFGVELDP